MSESPSMERVQLRRQPAGWQVVRYRLTQFLGGLRATVKPDDETPATAVLSPAEMALFRRMPSDARRHSQRVLEMLQAEDDVSHELAVAALLHDVGKVAAADAGAYLGLWIRGPLVLAEAIAPQWVVRLAKAQPSKRLRYALYVHIHHPEIGARWAEAAGCSELTCWLIAHHQDKLQQFAASGRAMLLARLQAADSLN